jgi:hypothetical protein
MFAGRGGKPKGRSTVANYATASFLTFIKSGCFSLCNFGNLLKLEFASAETCSMLKFKMNGNKQF